MAIPLIVEAKEDSHIINGMSVASDRLAEFSELVQAWFAEHLSVCCHDPFPRFAGATTIVSDSYPSIFAWGAPVKLGECF